MTPALLAACYDQHAPAVFGLAEWITGDVEVAAQLTSEVFAGLRYLSAEDGIEGLRGCVMTDVHRRAVAWTREHATPSAASRPLPFAPFADLPDDERTVIAEAYFGAKTYDAVAEMLAVDCADVARLMQQALRRLGTSSATPAVLSGRRRTA